MRSLIVILLLLAVEINSYKILVFSPTISRSHMISCGRIADELAKAGHEVVMLEPDFLKLYDKVKPTKLARRWPVRDFSDGLHNALQGFSGDVFKDLNVISMNEALDRYQIAWNDHCEDLINRDDLLEELKKEKFDAYVGEQIHPCGNGLAHVLGIKVHFWVSSCSIWEPMLWALNMPNPMSYVPAVVGLDVDSKMSYMDRVYNSLYGIVNTYYGIKAYNRADKIFKKKFGDDFPSVASIASSSDMIFVATDEFIEFPRPILPNIVHIGGLGVSDSEGELGDVFEKEMQKGKKGVVLISLGTVVNTTVLPNFVMDSFTSIAKSLPDYHFIVRCDKYDKYAHKVSENIPNMAVHEWIPQPSVLKDSRLKAFVTHAGYNGIIESARAGVPLVMMPFMFDQTRNSRAVAHSGWGIHLQRQLLRDDSTKISAALKEMLTNDKYKKAALRIQRLVKEKPFNASQRLLSYTEFVLNNGGVKELLIEGRNLNFIEYFNLDIFVPLFGVVIFAIYVLIRIVRRIFDSVSPATKQKSD